MVEATVTINGEPFAASIDHFALSTCHIQNMDELAKLGLFPRLRSASFAGTNLDDVGIAHLARVKTLDNLNLQDTEITDAGLAYLQSLPELRHLRLKGNPQLTNAGVRHLAGLVALVNLQVHETSITQAGLTLLTGLPHLRDICLDVRDGNYTFAGLLALSARLPDCRILAKGHGEFFNGSFDGTWHA